MNSPTVMEGTGGDGDEDENGHEDGSNDDGNYDDGEVDDDENCDAQSLKFTHTAHMCGGPKQVGGTKRLVDLKTY